MRWFKFFLLLLLFDAIADVFAEEWLAKGNDLRVLASWAFYASGAACWLLSFHRGAELGRGALIYSVSVAVMGVAIGLFYGEHLTTMRVIGGLLGMISMGLLLR
jgi:hypothetical protein